MKALIQKDFKENLKVALIGLLIFSVILLHTYELSISALTTLLDARAGQGGVLQPLQSTNLLTTAAFFCGIFGAALGWLQTRNEAHPDLWAFLIHRPVTRTDIFLAKSISGLCLYAIGTVLPLAILVVVVLTPGHVAAPFEWAMLLPLVSILLLGVPFYFAGLLTGRRHARWYVSRSFGLGLPIIAALVAFGVPEFWQSLIWILIAVALLATAAWGAYLSGGFYRGQPVMGKLALTIAITVGCGLAMLAAVGLLVNMLLNPLFNSRSYTYSTYQMTRDGTIYKVTRRDNDIVEVVDLEGHPLLDPVTHRTIPAGEFQKRFAFGPSVFTGQARRRAAFQDATRFFQLVNVTDKTLWYLDRHGKLIGYNGQTRKFIGSLDPHRSDGSPDHDPFLFNRGGYYFYNPYSGPPSELLPTATAVYSVDFRERSVKPVFSLPDDERIDGFTPVTTAGSGAVANFLLTTRRTVRLIDYEGKTIFALPYQPEYSEYPQVQLTILQPAETSTTNFAVWFYPDSETNRVVGWKMPIHVMWLGPDQAVTKRAELPELRLPENDSGPDQLLATLLPPVFHLLADHKINSVWNLCCFAVSSISAFIGLGLVKRYNLSAKARVGWTIFILLFGITGLLGLLCTEEWPAREMCPDCKKLRSVDRATCEHCGATFSPPEKNGSEIFAPLLKA